MKFELDDDVVLGISAAGTAAWGLSLLAVPKKIESAFMTEKTGSSPEIGRLLGNALIGTAAQQGAVSISDGSKEAKKNLLKAAGASWAFCAAHQLYNVQRGYQKDEATFAGVSGNAVMAALCLWRGFKDDDEE